MFVFTYSTVVKDFKHTVCFSFPSEAINVPMIPLGLKETKEVDFTVCIQVKKT